MTIMKKNDNNVLLVEIFSSAKKKKLIRLFSWLHAD